ncbi:MAG TPA: 3-dehydroquinate synthase [Polyangiaceae bacterium]|jgi:3-dehydroquinate synthase|nr:3-dehydroquinate synthase [Polyangiaceae bacterium]
MLHTQRFTVSYEYPVFFGRGVFSVDNPALSNALARREPARRHRAAFVVEERVAACWPDLVGSIARYAERHAATMQLAAPPLVVAGGEECKNDAKAPLALAAWLDELRIDRQSFVVVVGGGALQDMAGYAAATFHRGVRVVRIPTTVLSQNDSGVGVKNGVNALGKKNLFGSFAAPFAVLNDLDLLETLEPRDKAAGMAEAVKVALIKDAAFFGFLAQRADALGRFEKGPVAELVERCALLHLDHIARSGDPFELGSSRPLDFGHWAAHKLESMSSYALRHGEAVAIGIALDTRYSVEVGLLGEADGERVVSVLERLRLPTFDRLLDARDASGRRIVLRGIDEFREHLGGELTLMMLEALGTGHEVRSLDEAKLVRAIEWLGARAARAGTPSRSLLDVDDAPRAVAAAGS